MAANIAVDLDQELVDCKERLQDQAQAMLASLLEFESRLQARLELAEARINALRAIVENDRNRARG
jgi:hypothetical protein